jgi:hypothetical protein
MARSGSKAVIVDKVFPRPQTIHRDAGGRADGLGDAA